MNNESRIRSENSFPGHVTHLVSGDLWGGAEAFVYALAKHQFENRPTSVSCVVMNSGQLATRLQNAGVPTNVLDESKNGVVSLLRATLAHIKRQGTTILHSHRHKENILALASALITHRPMRRVATLHGLPEPILGANNVYLRLKDRLNFLSLRYGFDTIVAVSNDIERRITPKFPFKGVTCVHNGVEPADNLYKACRLPLRSSPHLVALGRLVPIKRFERIAELSVLLSASFQSPPRLTLAGDGPMREQLSALYAARGVHVEMPGFVNESMNLLRSADGMLITSDHEGIPMSVLEALSVGVPVFGFAVGGLPEIAMSGVPLFLAPAGDTSALAMLIKQFFTSNRYGVRVEPPPDWSFAIKQSAQRYAALYRGSRPIAQATQEFSIGS